MRFHKISLETRYAYCPWLKAFKIETVNVAFYKVYHTGDFKM